MPTDLLPVTEYGLDGAAAVLTRAFADYFVKIPFTAGALLQLVRADSVDLAASRVLVRDGAAAGAALIARRGWTSRLAGMALLPEARQQGLGAGFMDRLVTEARGRGEHAMILEVIERNVPAVRLYEKCGFHKVRRLVEFVAPGDSVAALVPAAAEEIDIRAAAMSLACAGPDWPWQLSAETVAHLTPPTRAFRLDDACVVVTGLPGVDVTIRAATPVPSLVPLLRGLRAQFPGSRWQIKAIWPEEHGGLFAAAGFQRAELSQWQMAKPLQP